MGAGNVNTNIKYSSYYIDLLKHVLDQYCKRNVFNKAEIN